MEAGNRFFDRPILNSPYKSPGQHWELDGSGQPTNRIVNKRRDVSFITPIPGPKKGKGAQHTLNFDEEARRVAADGQQYELASTINSVRNAVHDWRQRADLGEWRVTPETARLLHHWRHHEFNHFRPFFCQVEAVETVIWLTEVAPQLATGKRFVEHLERANNQANPDLSRLALKLATGAGKTTVMAMLIAWQTINAVRRPNSRRFSRGFLVVTPGITIKDRLRVLQPNDPDSYYRSRELVPCDMLGDLDRAKVVITNFHAFNLRETMDVSKGGRALLQGRGPELRSQETEGQMLKRVMPELMGMKNVLALNDEAHHCYREKPGEDDEGKLTGDDRKEAEKNRDAARLWMSGLEAVGRSLGLSRVLDLSATPFFLRGSGYAEGTLFPWTVSDFSLMDAIECGIVKLPRVPVADNIPGADMPKFRNLWEHIGKDMPKKGRGKASELDPLLLPVPLQTALQALYGHYERTFSLWEEAGIEVPPCFIVVCNNTSTSKLIYDYISGFERENPDGSTQLVNGRLELFRNFDDYGNAIARPRTLLIDSEQLESGEALDRNFRTMAADEIDRFRREIVERTGDRKRAENLSDQDLLREAMNTVGKEGRLGGVTRCVVSVSMLTEGWDANTVTHVLGVRAFGTQLLCEQAIGRSLRRQSYELNDNGVLPVEYADVLGIPFDFTAKPMVALPQKPRKTVEVRAISPERDACEIRFPRVAGYRVELPEERLQANFRDDSTLVLTPALVGPSRTRNEGIIGEGVDLDLVHTGNLRSSTLLFHLTKRLLETKWRDPGEEPKLHLFGQLKRIARQWLDNHLVCEDGTYPAQLMYLELADRACERITQAIVAHHVRERPVKVVLDPFNPSGSTSHVRFATSKKTWKTDARYCHINHVVCDSDWEAEFCRIAEGHPRVRAYTKNHGLGLEVPYRNGSESRIYIPDFVVLVDDGHGADDLLHLVVEIKGYPDGKAAEKRSAMETYWVPGVNALGSCGRWKFVEFTDIRDMEAAFYRTVERLRSFTEIEAGRRLTGKGEAAGSQARGREEVLALLRAHKAELMRQFHILDLFLFGSVARGATNGNGDVDVLVRFDGPATSDRYFGAQFYIEDLLGRPVDLVTDKALHEDIRPHVERDAIHV
ncbi:MAG: nucleotidyltransferase domain-containing protein [Rhodospirillaceae bacterium]|nr:nucleotidyltransferase domain-containing protein [Rhodospirillaceae bacterium]